MSQTAVNKVAAMAVSSTGAVAIQGAQKRVLNISTTTVIKTGPGQLFGGSVIAVSSSGPVQFYDAPDASGGSITPAKMLYTATLNSIGAFTVAAAGYPFVDGLVVVPPAGATITVFYS